MTVTTMRGSAIRHGALPLALVLALAACGGSATGPATVPPASPGSGAYVGGEVGGGSAAADALCALFSAGEIAAVIGETPQPGRPAGPLDSGCQWLGATSDADLMIQKVPLDYVEDWSAADGYRELDGIGESAYVVPHPFGRLAAATAGDAGYIVVLDPPPADDAPLLALLASFVERGAPIALVVPTEPPPDGGTDGGAVPPAPGAECPVSTAAVSDALGVPMADGAGACSWTAVDAGGGLFEAYYETAPLIAFPNPDGTPIAGLGDEAYVDGLGTLWVRVGERAFSIQVLSMGDGSLPASEDAATRIARLVVDALR